MKKKSVIFIAVLFLIFFVTTGCTTTKPAEEQQEVVNETALQLTERGTAELADSAQQVSDAEQVKVAEVVQKVKDSEIGQILGDLYVMAIGINEYSNNVFTGLKYAANDAKNICDVFERQAGKVFRNVNKMLIADKGSVTPTKDNILKNMAFFKDVKSNDTVVLFIAAHRIIIEGKYYLMTSDSKYTNDEGFVLSTFISFDDIIKQLNFKANKLLIIDTNAPDFKGADITVLRACKENEQAIESSLYSGGLLTASIVSAFENIETEYGLITVNNLFDYIAEKVGEMSEQKQTPVLSLASGVKDMIVGFLLGYDVPADLFKK